MRYRWLGVLLFAGPLTAGLAGTSEPITAFVDIAVIPMDSERVLAHQTVVVRGDRIVALGPAAEVRVPVGAQRVAGAGQFLLPGLGDMHFHITPDDSALAERGMLIALAHGVTTARNMAGSPLHLALRARVARGELLGPRLYTAGPVMHPADFPTPGDAARVVAEQQAAGYDFMKVYNGDWYSGTWRPEVLDSLKAAATRAGFRLSGHLPTTDSVGLEWALSVPYRSMEHLYGYVQYLGLSETDSTPLDEARLRRIAVQTKRSGVWNDPTLLAVSTFNASGWGDLRLDILNRVVVALHHAGAGLLLGTDVSWGTRCSPRSSPIRSELRLLVAAGLTPYQALETGTRNVAAFFGTLDSVGTVAVGKRADLVLVKGNPLSPADDFASLDRPVGIMIGGRWLSRATLDRDLAALGVECSAEQEQRPHGNGP